MGKGMTMHVQGLSSVHFSSAAARRQLLALRLNLKELERTGNKPPKGIRGFSQRHPRAYFRTLLFGLVIGLPTSYMSLKAAPVQRRLAEQATVAAGYTHTSPQERKAAVSKATSARNWENLFASTFWATALCNIINLGSVADVLLPKTPRKV